MLYFKVDKRTLEYGVARLQDMCLRATSSEELDKIRLYQAMVINQARMQQDLVSWRIAINCCSNASDRIFKKAINSIKRDINDIGGSR